MFLFHQRMQTILQRLSWRNLREKPVVCFSYSDGSVVFYLVNVCTGGSFDISGNRPVNMCHGPWPINLEKKHVPALFDKFKWKGSNKITS
jgi:hypothetical protein